VITVGICLVRNGEDVIGPVVRHTLGEVDFVIVADNLSSDDTRPTLEALRYRYPHRLVVVDDPDPAHRQSWKTTRLAEWARTEFAADWIVPFDSDEIWYSPFGRISDVLAATAERTALATLYDHIATSADYPFDTNPIRRLGWRRREPSPLHKVATRAAPDLTIEEGNHHARYDTPTTTIPDRLVVRHFPYRTAEQMAEKARIGAAALRAAGLPNRIGKHWHDYDALGPELVAEVFAEHFFATDPELRDDLIFDPAPANP